jgi:hypothetical protein
MKRSLLVTNPQTGQTEIQPFTGGATLQPAISLPAPPQPTKDQQIQQYLRQCSKLSTFIRAL